MRIFGAKSPLASMVGQRASLGSWTLKRGQNEQKQDQVGEQGKTVERDLIQAGYARGRDARIEGSNGKERQRNRARKRQVGPARMSCRRWRQIGGVVVGGSDGGCGERGKSEDVMVLVVVEEGSVSWCSSNDGRQWEWGSGNFAGPR